MLRSRVLTFVGVLAISLLLAPPFAFSATMHGVSSVTSYVINLIDSIRFWLCIVPQVCNLLLIMASVFLMLDGIRRWGSNRAGAFSRSLIGLFILHTSSLSLPFLPYLALFLEIWLCASGLEERTKAKLAQKS